MPSTLITFKQLIEAVIILSSHYLKMMVVELHYSSVFN